VLVVQAPTESVSHGAILVCVVNTFFAVSNVSNEYIYVVSNECLVPVPIY
jgi:hypothetical protein